MKIGNGIVVAKEGGTIEDDEVAYDSLDSHLLVDSSSANAHMGIFELFGSPAATTYSYPAGGSKTEELWSIKHNLPFIPRVAMYMLVRDAPAALAAQIGSYNSRTMYSSFPINEAVFFRVDTTHVRLMHIFAMQGATGPTGSFTSVMQDVKLKVKYMIFNNIGANEPYDGEFYGL